MTFQKAVEQRALRVLRQKRLYEGQLDQLYQQSYNMEQATMTTENLRNTMATVDAMNTANKDMRKTYGKIDLDKIERVQDDMEDMIEQANEVQATLGRSYGVPDEIDEDELQAELDALYVYALMWDISILRYFSVATTWAKKRQRLRRI